MEVLYGLHPVEEAVRSGSRRLDCVMLARERKDERLERLAEACRSAGVRISLESRDHLTRTARTDAHQGVVALVRERAFLGIEDLLNAKTSEQQHRFFLALDGIEDPHNLGALLRTADGAGVDGVILPERRSAPVSATVAKTSAGASEHVRIARVTNLVRSLEQMKQANVWVLGLDERGTPDYTDFDFRTDCVLVLGREGAGPARPRQEDLRSSSAHPHGRNGLLAQRLCRRRGRYVRSHAPAPRATRSQACRASQTAQRIRLLIRTLLRRLFNNSILVTTALAVALFATLASAQTSQPPATQPPKPAAPDQSAEPAIPAGKVLFSRDSSSQPADSQTPDDQTPHHASATRLASRHRRRAQRTHLHQPTISTSISRQPRQPSPPAPASPSATTAPCPLKRLVLQISSTLHWDSISSRTSSGALSPLAFATHRVPTDADHTGEMEEAVVTLPQPLAAGGTLTLATLYSGTIQPSAHRLERIGAPTDQALAEDWDAIAAPTAESPANGTALRGFGNVLWYPVSAPQVFLGEGATLFQSVGATKLRQSAATVRLRLAVEYVGDPPDSAFFCGHHQPLAAISDNPDLPAAQAVGVATALFDSRPLGFRTPSLFVTGSAATTTGTPANPDLIAAVTGHYDTLPAYSAAAAMVEPLITDWLGARPLTQLSILDHPGQPFEDGALLVRPMYAVDPKTLAPALAHSLTHAWFRSSHAWIDEGLAQFMSILWTERTAGRPAALAQLQQEAQGLALMEPEIPVSESHDASVSSNDSPTATAPDQTPKAKPSVSPAGTSLVDATGDVFYRTKAAAVWWMLRTLVGDDALKESLQAYRRDPQLDHDPLGLEHTVERISHKDLHWFFNDWVYRDRGLPDLSIVSITPSQQVGRTGLPTGYLVAIVVRNDGYATADVPVTVRSGNASQTERLRIPGQTTVSTRIVFAGTPDTVEVNDGGVPENVTSIHTRQLVLAGH